MTGENLSLFDPECIKSAKEGILEGTSGIGIDQTFDPTSD
jgi:hypothetical protein